MAANIPSRPILGIGWMLLGGLVMTVNNAILKWLSVGYPAGQIMFIRSVFILLPIAYFIARSGGFLSIRVRRVHMHFVWSGCMILSTVIYIAGLPYLPLADVTAIGFSTPLFVTALATFLIGEVVGWRRWSAVAVGFLGIVIIAKPTGNLATLAVLFPLASAFWTAQREILTRRMVATESSNAILATSTAAVMIAGLCTAPFGWKMPSAVDFGLMACAGLFAGFGHYFMIEAFRYAEVVIVSPFRYITILWAIVLGYLAWGDLPDGYVIVGITLVVGSGLYILHREIVAVRERRRALPPQPEPAGFAG
jgi:drug/metabolite transporter (DMT)-like permease